MDPLLIITEVADQGSYITYGIKETVERGERTLEIEKPNGLVVEVGLTLQSYGDLSKYVKEVDGKYFLNKHKIAVDILAGTLPIKGKKL